MCNIFPLGWHFIQTVSLVTILIATPTHSHTYTKECTHTCAFADDLHHGGREVAHPVISCSVVMDTAFPASVRVLLQNLSGRHNNNIEFHKLIRASPCGTLQFCEFYTPTGSAGLTALFRAVFSSPKVTEKPWKNIFLKFFLSNRNTTLHLELFKILCVRQRQSQIVHLDPEGGRKGAAWLPYYCNNYPKAV